MTFLFPELVLFRGRGNGARDARLALGVFIALGSFVGFAIDLLWGASYDPEKVRMGTLGITVAGLGIITGSVAFWAHLLAKQTYPIFALLPFHRAAFTRFHYTTAARYLLPVLAGVWACGSISTWQGQSSPVFGLLALLQFIAVTLFVMRLAWWAATWLSVVVIFGIPVAPVIFANHGLARELSVPGFLLVGTQQELDLQAVIACLLALAALATLAGQLLRFCNFSSKLMAVVLFVALAGIAGICIPFSPPSARGVASIITVIAGTLVIVLFPLIVTAGVLRLIDQIRASLGESEPRMRSDEERRIFDVVWRGTWRYWDMGIAVGILGAMGTAATPRIETMQNPETLRLIVGVLGLSAAVIFLAPGIFGRRGADRFLSVGCGATLPVSRSIRMRLRRKLAWNVLLAGCVWAAAIAFLVPRPVYFGGPILCLLASANLALLTLNLVNPLLWASSGGEFDWRKLPAYAARFVYIFMLAWCSANILPRVFFMQEAVTESSITTEPIQAACIWAVAVILILLQLDALRREARDEVDRRLPQLRLWTSPGRQRRYPRREDSPLQARFRNVFHRLGITLPDEEWRG